MPELAWGQNQGYVLVAQGEDLAEAERLNQQAFQLYQEGKYSEAIPLAEKALAIRQRILGQEHPDVATSLNNLAALYESQGRYEEAEPLYRQALEMRRRILEPEHPDVATSLNNLAALYESQGRYEEAEPLYRQALQMYQRILGQEHPHVATSLNNLAGLYRSQGRYEEAEPLFRQALEMWKRTLGQQHPDVATSLNDLAGLYRIQGRYEEAESLYRQALEMMRRLLGQEHPSIASSLNNLALLYNSQGRYEEAESLYRQALEMMRRLLGQEHPSIASSLNNLALLYNSQGRYEEAEPLYRQALEMRRRILGQEHPSVASSLNNLAFLYNSQGRYEEAEPLYRQALEMRRRILGQEHPSVASSLNNLAFLYERQGRYEEVEPLYRQALEMRRRILGQQHPDIAASLNNLAVLYKSQGRYEEAEPLYHQALEMRRRILGQEHPDVATSLNNLALLYESQGRYEEAEPLLRQALEMRRRLLGQQHPDVAASLNDLAGLYWSQGRYEEAEPLLRQALEMRRRLLGQQHPDVAASLNNLTVLYWSQGKISLAIANFTQGLAIQEANLVYNTFAGFERQKRDYLKTLSGTTNAPISLHLNYVPNNPEAANLAFTTILQRKGRVLSFFANSLQNLRQSVEPEDQKLLNKLTTAYSQLANLIHNRPEELPLEQYKAQVASLETEVKELEGELSERNKRFRQEFQTPNRESIQELIPANTALLEFAKYQPFNPQTQEWAQPHYAVYILTPQGEPQGIDLGEAETIEKAIKQFRVALGSPKTSQKQYQQSARNLDKLVMEPVRKLLGDSKQILLAPQAALNLIPFEALVDEEERFLVENYAFTYLTSGRDLLKLTNANPSQEPPLIIANPNFEVPAEIASLDNTMVTRGEEVKRLPSRVIRDISQIPSPSLPGTKEEAEAIGEKLGVIPLMNRQATEAAIKNSNSPKILHIATHGFFKSSFKSELEEQTYQDNPLLLSGLVLAGFRKEQSGSNEDGILTAQEVSALDLVGTKLVVLSACDTGLGKLDTGEGLYSLRRALVIAGAESQLISLWKVEDNATKELMIAYYDKLLANQGRSEALRQTQLEMLNSEEYAHPYYWAAFIPSGDWRAMDNG
ncbi:MAG: CHAT domain-containing protein [Symploca sp. SIO3E6]|nr:CHAT domain-containing protein [Caldora sp. SIO3E6]